MGKYPIASNPYLGHWEFYTYTKILVILYADDTVIIAEDENKLQASLDNFLSYCKKWKLQINYKKTKILIFGARNIEKFKFYLDGNLIEIVDNFKYLGVYFSSSRSFLKARRHNNEQARKALYVLNKRIRNLHFPIDIQLKLFDHTIAPILFYGSEIWGYENVDSIEKFCNAFLRQITGLKNSTPLFMLHAELGRHPVNIDIKMRMLNFWLSLVNSKPNKLSHIMYNLLRAETNSGIYEHKWIKHMQKILQEAGRADVWLTQTINNTNAFKASVKRTLLDQNIQQWHTLLDISSKGKNYRIFKSDIRLENYLLKFPKKLYYPLIRFRTTNHKLPVELGRWSNVPLNERTCTKCAFNCLGDEFHYLFECEYFKHDRHLLIKRYFYIRPNILKYHQIMNSQNKTIVKNLSLFVQKRLNLKMIINQCSPKVVKRYRTFSNVPVLSTCVFISYPVSSRENRCLQ